MTLPLLRVLALLALCFASAQAASPYKEPVTFSYTGDVGFGNSVFVVGNHSDLGNWDPTRAVKLRYTPGNVWTGAVAIQAGTQLQYRFIARNSTNAQWCNSSNVNWLTPDLFRTIPAQPAESYSGKTIYYLTAWSSVDLIFSSNGGSFTSAAMLKVGAGRTPGESLYKITGVGETSGSLQFVFTDGNGNFDKAPGGVDYLTELDVFHVQDGNVFSYQPPPTVSAPQVVVTNDINSSYGNIPKRTVRIYLPRGYQQNTTRRYPVLYLHDGQNVFDPGGPFGSWSANATATREIGQGRMRETIMVAIDNTNARIAEYMPPTDSYQGTQGRGDAYAGFVINNVRPFIDFNYRTLNDPKNTVLMGSSLGGLISLYFGREFSTFGKIGVLSPAFWIAPNYIAQVQNGTKKPLRVYLDFGTAEPADDWDNALSMYDVHLAQGYAANGDVTFVGGCGQAHNEAAWAARLPQTLRYLLPAREEPAELAQREFPPRFAVTDVDAANHTALFSFRSAFGFTYRLERSPDLRQWTAVMTTSPETLPWTDRTLTDQGFPNGDRFFWRLIATPAP